MSEPVEHRLPDRRQGVDGLCPRCPWCRDQIDDLVVPIEALTGAWEAGHLTGQGNWLYRDREFTGAPCACPRCGKGLLLKFVVEPEEPVGQQRSIVIAPMMSEADARYLAEKMSLF